MSLPVFFIDKSACKGLFGVIPFLYIGSVLVFNIGDIIMIKIWISLTIFLVISFCIMFCGRADSGDGNTPKKIPGYKLVWADEFSRNGPPDPEFWHFDTGFVRNEELQWYQPENAVCKGGYLIIEGRRERVKNTGYKKDSKNWKENRQFAEYTSAEIITKQKITWMYGRFEVRARIKTRDGLWPAIWFLGEKGEWPSCGEIDLMEYYNGNILANACWGSKERWKGQWDSAKKPVASFNDPQWDSKFHVWRMDWDDKKISLYVDDILLNDIDITKTINPVKEWGPENPFRQPHYILLNLAIGGTSGGDPSKTEFPTLFEVDYVRVYQKDTASR